MSAAKKGQFYDSVNREVKQLGSRLAKFMGTAESRHGENRLNLDETKQRIDRLQKALEDAEHRRMSKYYQQVATVDRDVRIMEEKVKNHDIF